MGLFIGTGAVAFYDLIGEWLLSSLCALSQRDHRSLFASPAHDRLGSRRAGARSFCMPLHASQLAARACASPHMPAIDWALVAHGGRLNSVHVPAAPVVDHSFLIDVRLLNVLRPKK